VGAGDTDGVAADGYQTAASFQVAASTDTTLATGAGLANAHVYTVTYGANISGITPAGSYTGSTDFTVYGDF
jgi:hypothetical protein